MTQKGPLDDEVLSRIRAEEETEYRVSLEAEARQRIRDEIRSGYPVDSDLPLNGLVPVNTVDTVPARLDTVAAPALFISAVPSLLSPVTAVVPAPTATSGNTNLPVDTGAKGEQQPWFLMICAAIGCTIVVTFIVGFVLGMFGLQEGTWLYRILGSAEGAAFVIGGLLVTKHKTYPAAMALFYMFIAYVVLSTLIIDSAGLSSSYDLVSSVFGLIAAFVMARAIKDEPST